MKNHQPTKIANRLKQALEKLGIKVFSEKWDGRKHVDLSIPDAKLDIEVDGTQHLTNPKQIVADLNREYYSGKEGRGTIHIPNTEIDKDLSTVAEAIAIAAKTRERNINHTLKNFRIETSRLLLTPLSMTYIEEMFKEFNADVTKYMYPAPAQTIEDSKKFVLECEEHFSKGEEVVVAILKKDTLEYLGNGGLHHIDTRKPELGVWIKISAHGNGYGKEAMTGLKEWADKNVLHDYIVYPVDEANIPSSKIAESLGGKVANSYTKLNQSNTILNINEYHIPSVQ